MNDLVLLALARDALFLTLKVAAVPLGVSLVVGVAIAFVQAIIQIQEMTVTFVPKLIAMFISLILFGTGKWAPSLDRLNDLLGHNIDPRNVEFIIRMFNTPTKFDRKLFLQVLLMQTVQQPTPSQRALIEAELRALTEPS